MDNLGGFMNTAFFCHLDKIDKNIAENNQFSVEFDIKEAWQFVEFNWHKLNQFSEDNNISEKTNREISNMLVHYFISNEIELD